MRYVLTTTVCLAALAIAGCSKSGSESSYSNSSSYRSPPAMADVASGSNDGAPGINVTAAPGVAFNYAYAFRLPAAAIKDAQEAHAQACEKLGIEHCRITGMHYTVNGENDVRGELDFKLDPAAARAFGKQGIDAVVKANGKLVNAEITGTDAGAEIAKFQTLRAQAEDELKRIDKELARPDLKSDERVDLQNQRTRITSQINDAKSNTNDQQASLATTPMTFSYESGPAVEGFDGSAPITSAGNIFIGSATITIGLVLTVLAALLPPGLIFLVVFLLWRRFRPRKPTPPPAG